MGRHTWLVIFTAVLFPVGHAHAACFGTPAFETCNDASGNQYTVNRFGNTTTMQGYNPNTGSQWSQQSNTLGNTTQTYGQTNGRQWNETQTYYGNGFGNVRGMNSQGQFYNYNCTPYGGCR